MSQESENEEVVEAEEPVDRQTLMSVRETLRGRRILLTGSTGFLGKVYASMILAKHPDIEQLYLVIRPRTGETAQDRFVRELAECGAFDPLREIYGAGLKIRNVRGVERFLLLTGAGADTVYVYGVLEGTQVLINTGSGADTVEFGGPARTFSISRPAAGITTSTSTPT